MRNLTRPIVVCLPLFMLLAGPAGAAPRQEQTNIRGSVTAPVSASRRAQARAGVSLDEAAAMVRRQTDGRIIKASTRRSNGRAVHYIRVLTRDGKVFTVRVDAATGRVL